MVAALKLLGANNSDISIVTEDCAQIDEARISTAYFSPSGFGSIASAIETIPSIRLLLGTDPIADSEMWNKQVAKKRASLLKTP